MQASPALAALIKVEKDAGFVVDQGSALHWGPGCHAQGCGQERSS